MLANPDPNKPGVHAVDYPNRREGISVECLSRTGEAVSLGCVFTRTDSGIEFGEVPELRPGGRTTGLNLFEEPSRYNESGFSRV